jgi:hypothetical protein
MTYIIKEVHDIYAPILFPLNQIILSFCSQVHIAKLIIDFSELYLQVIIEFTEFFKAINHVFI